MCADVLWATLRLLRPSAAIACAGTSLGRVIVFLCALFY